MTRDLVTVPLPIQNESLWGPKRKTFELRRRGRQRESWGDYLADVDGNGIDHISPLSLTPYYQGGRRERQTGRGKVSKRHGTGKRWRDDSVPSISRGFTAVREALFL